MLLHYFIVCMCGTHRVSVITVSTHFQLPRAKLPESRFGDELRTTKRETQVRLPYYAVRILEVSSTAPFGRSLRGLDRSTRHDGASLGDVTPTLSALCVIDRLNRRCPFTTDDRRIGLLGIERRATSRRFRPVW